MNTALKVRPRFPTGPDMVLDMPLDSGFMSGVLVQDRSQSGYTGTAQGGTGTPLPARPGFSFVVASTQNIVGSDVLVTAFPYTISVWFNTTENTTTKAFLGASASAVEGFTEVGAFVKTAVLKARATTHEDAGESASANITAAASLHDGKWHNVVGVYRSDTDKDAYLDGVFGANNTTDASVLGTLDTWYIGGREIVLNIVTTKAYMEGKIGDCLVFIRELSAVEIKNLYELQRWRYGV